MTGVSAGTYSVTLERGSDGSYLAWVDDLPGCAVRARSREEVLEQLPSAIVEFVAWTDGGRLEAPAITVSAEVSSAIEADEDTEVLVESDREPLTEDDWLRARGWLERSRSDLLQLLDGLSGEELDRRRAGSERTLREEIEHVAFVELMYAAWTFDLSTRDGLRGFLVWTRDLAASRLDDLSERGADDLTSAEWAGAPLPEPWTPRKAARRLVWHELLHLRAMQGRHRGRTPRI
ncbi:MAG: type II toxin-antitoxin system HicB family antitoxin [Gaiellaceae bacterium]